MHDTIRIGCEIPRAILAYFTDTRIFCANATYPQYLDTIRILHAYLGRLQAAWIQTPFDARKSAQYFIHFNRVRVFC